MIEAALLNQTDFGQINIQSLEDLIIRLREDSNWKDQPDPARLSSTSEWIKKGWKHIVDHSEQLESDSVHPESSITPITRFATVWARLTRDLAGGMKDCQDALRSSIDYIIKILWFTSAVIRLDHTDFKAFNQFSVQALSNLITSNAASINHTWPLLIECEERQSILLRLLYTNNQKLLLATAVLILNSVHKSTEKIQSLISSLVGQKIMRMLLERLDGLLDDETDVVFEVIVSLVREIIDDGPVSRAPALYYSQVTPSQLLSPAQLSILKVSESSTILPTPSFLLIEFGKLYNCLEQTWQGFVLVTEMLVRWIEIFQETRLNKDESISDDEAYKAVEISIAILKELSERKSNYNQANFQDEGCNKRRSFNQILIALIKLLTGLIEFKNLSDTNSALQLQDLVRNLNGIAIILSFTNFDVDFPYLREHSILLIKYLLRDNMKNQEIIRKLEPKFLS